MDYVNLIMESDMAYPVIFMPKKCSPEHITSSGMTKFIANMNFSLPNTEGFDFNYSGYVTLRLVEICDDNYNLIETLDENNSCGPLENNDINEMPLILSDASQRLSPLFDDEIWSEPPLNPYMYNQYGVGVHPVRESRGHITIEHNNTYVTQNIINYTQSNTYSGIHQPAAREDSNNYRQVQDTFNHSNSVSIFEEDELECESFVSNVPEDTNNQANQVLEERKYIGLQSENNALKQLMSKDIQSVSKQRKTILFLEHSSGSVQTIQNISYDDPSIKCCAPEADNEVVIDYEPSPTSKKKKYRCDKCKKIFDNIAEFRHHIGGSHAPPAPADGPPEDAFTCLECGKKMKDRRRYEIHCLGHGDPDLECPKCHKVYASKFTLRAHLKIHDRKHPCGSCKRAYSTARELAAHEERVHYVFRCQYENCAYVTDKNSLLNNHHDSHVIQEYTDGDDVDTFDVDDIGADWALPQTTYKSELSSQCDGKRKAKSAKGISDWATSDVTGYVSDVSLQDGGKRRVTRAAKASADWAILEAAERSDPSCDDGAGRAARARGGSNAEADSVIQKVMSSKLFHLHPKKANKEGRGHKSCQICGKTFDRVSDLKRHLIEHVIKSTLAKSPVSRAGLLHITCEICQTETFDKVEKYKAHLRNHAKLTLYQCTFCDKSFSDSSNFSKHKKVHGDSFLQCDLCHRKFNSKKMIAQHMEYHNSHKPIKCEHCHRTFHFKSTLNKHVKSTHKKISRAKYRCRFCGDTYGSLKDKWDHEWVVHSSRKMAADCVFCGTKFRKNADLNRHLLDSHSLELARGLPLRKMSKRISRMKASY